MACWLVVFIVSLPFLLLFLRENKGPIQFSLRTLLVAVTLVALVLGGIGWWRTANLAQVRWLDPASPEALALFPLPEVVQNDEGEWMLVYDSHCPPMQVEVVSEDREEVESHLRTLQDSDKLGPGEMVIRGRVEDLDGKPVPGAMVDLMGPSVYINHFETGADGTFVMPITPKVGWGYYLRVRPSNAERRSTGRFSLSYDEPERVAIVRLP